MLLGWALWTAGLFFVGFVGGRVLAGKHREYADRFKTSVAPNVGILAISITPDDLFRISVCSGIAGAGFGMFLAMQAGALAMVFLGVVFAVGAFSAPKVFVALVCARRRELFVRQLPDAIDMMCRAMGTGRVIMGSMQLAAEEMPAPLSEEFRISLGIVRHTGRDEGLELLAERMRLPDVRMFVVVMQLTMTKGGDSVEPLRNLSVTLRNRFNMERKVRALISQVKLQAIVIAMLPAVVFVAFLFIVPDMMHVFLHHPIGPFVIGLVVLLELLGGYVMWKMSQLDY